MIQLFDYIKLIFTADDKKWHEVSATDKARNFFMMSRFLSIKYPAQVSILSHIKINAASTSDYWHVILKRMHTSVPGWIYAKTRKKAIEEKKKNGLSEEMIKWYCQKEEISRKDYERTVKFFGEEFIEELTELEKVLRSQGYFK